MTGDLFHHVPLMKMHRRRRYMPPIVNNTFLGGRIMARDAATSIMVRQERAERHPDTLQPDGLYAKGVRIPKSTTAICLALLCLTTSLSTASPTTRRLYPYAVRRRPRRQGTVSPLQEAGIRIVSVTSRSPSLSFPSLYQPPLIISPIFVVPVALPGSSSWPGNQAFR